MEGEDPSLAQHLEEQVDIMGYDHEFGQSRSAENGMVQGLQVCHLELDVVRMIVFFCPKGNSQSMDP
jgi:hypothetical protein